MQKLSSFCLKNPFVGGILLVALSFFLFEIRATIISLFVSYIIMATLSPLVNFFEKRRIPHIIAVSVSFFFALTLIILLIVPLIPFVVSQLNSLFNSFPNYLNKASQLIGIEINVNELKESLTSDISILGKRALALTSTLFGSLFAGLTIIVVSFYMLLYRKKVNNGLISLLPENYKKKAEEAIVMTEEKLGAWVRGQVLLSLAIGFFTWIALFLLGIQFALPLAILAGILEIIPTIGPIISAVPAIIVAINISPTTAAFVAIAYIIIQVLENNILVPKIMEKAVGLNPIIIIISVATGAKLFGIVGALLSVPFVSVLIILLKTFK